MRNQRAFKDRCRSNFAMKMDGTNPNGRYGSLTAGTVPAISISEWMPDQGTISVYIHLADWAGKKDSCWPSIPTIAKDLKLSESTTRRALNDLRKAGLVETEQRYRENGGNSSLLFLLKL